jgi:hypothetical protein
MRLAPASAIASFDFFVYCSLIRKWFNNKHKNGVVYYTHETQISFS